MNLNAEKFKKKAIRIQRIGAVLTILGLIVFAYFVYSTGVSEILSGISKIGLGGFLLLLALYMLRLTARAIAWDLSIVEPYKLSLKDTFPAVVIGEALSSIIPLGILVSGTAKALAIRSKVPFVIAFSSVATENSFYSFSTGLFICVGAYWFLQTFALPAVTVYAINALIGLVIFALVLGALMIIRHWHWVSGICEWIYGHGYFTAILENGRKEVRKFEDIIYGFYREYPRRFVPIILLQTLFHILGAVEAWLILSWIGDIIPKFSTAIFLESISRLVTVVFKLVPFVIGVDEAGAEFVTKALGVGIGLGVTLAIIRKGRILFWSAVGMLLITRREFGMKDFDVSGE